MASWLASVLGTASSFSDDENDEVKASGNASEQVLSPLGIAKAIERLEHATLASDRRAALRELHGSLPLRRQIVLNSALPAILATLHRPEIHDPECAKLVLSSLLCILDCSSDRLLEPHASRERQNAQAAARFFISSQRPSHFVALTALLNDEGDEKGSPAAPMQVQLYCVHLLLLLSELAGPRALARALLETPNAVSKVIGAATSNFGTSALCAPALRLLCSITSPQVCSPELQSALAFGSIFEKTIGILEPLIESVHQNPKSPAHNVCLEMLQLLRNLVLGNPVTQLAFCDQAASRYADASMMAKLANVLALSMPTDVKSEGGLDLLFASVSVYVALLGQPASSAAKKIREAAKNAPRTMPLILELSLASHVPLLVRARVLRVLSALVYCNTDFQHFIANGLIRVENKSRTAFSILMQHVIEGTNIIPPANESETSKQDDSGNQNVLLLRISGLACIEAFLHNNPVGKTSVCISAVNPPPEELNETSNDIVQGMDSDNAPSENDANNDSVVGDAPAHLTSVLLGPLLDWRQVRDEWRIWFSAAVLSAAVFDNSDCMSDMNAVFMKAQMPSSSQHQSTDLDLDTSSAHFYSSTPLVLSVAHTLFFASRRGHVSERSSVALLFLLFSMLWNNGKTAKMFVTVNSETSNTGDLEMLMFLLDLVGSNEVFVLTQGIAAFVISTLCLFHPKNDALKTIVHSRVPPQLLLERMEALRNDERLFLRPNPLFSMTLQSEINENQINDFLNQYFFTNNTAMALCQCYNYIRCELYSDLQDCLISASWIVKKSDDFLSSKKTHTEDEHLEEYEKKFKAQIESLKADILAKNLEISQLKAKLNIRDRPETPGTNSDSREASRRQYPPPLPLPPPKVSQAQPWQEQPQQNTLPEQQQKTSTTDDSGIPSGMFSL